MPVRFVCPECRRTLSVTRRKIGQQVNCPKCAAPITVPASQPALAATANTLSLPAELEQFDVGVLVDFEDRSELMGDEPSIRAGQGPAMNLAKAPVAPNRVSVSRTAIYLQAALLLLIAAVAFGLGYWLGGVDAQRNSQSQDAAATQESHPL